DVTAIEKVDQAVEKALLRRQERAAARQAESSLARRPAALANTIVAGEKAVVSGAEKTFVYGQNDVTTEEIDKLFEGANSGAMFPLPGKDPRTGSGLAKIQIKADEAKDIAYHVNLRFKGIQGAPGGKPIEVRYHSANRNAPEGSYSRTNPTTQINSTDGFTY